MNKILRIFIVFMLLTCILTNYVQADIVGSMRYKWSSLNETDKQEMKTMGGKVLGIVQVVGYAIAIIILSIMGIKYMYAAAGEKAKIKEQLIPYVIGATILFATSTIISIINKFVSGIHV